ncbi:hypothetical protein OIU76_019723 [Salix suchowensis]|nr:hypothetical protein OIU76_019723 [Salix suchowensis]
MTNSQGFEALKDDESTSGHTVPEEKSEEQNQTPAVALLSKEKDCGTEMIMENIEEYVHVELPADPHNYSPPKITEDISELDVSGLGAKLNTGIQKDSLNEVQVTKRETQQIMEERENAKNDEPVDLGEETTKECQEEYELKAEESLGDNGTQKDIQNEELYKEVEKADENERTEKKMDTERIIEHLHLAAAENETVWC